MTKQAIESIGSGIVALQLIKTYNSDRAGLATRFPGMSKGVRIARGESFQFWNGGTTARLPQEWPKCPKQLVEQRSENLSHQCSGQSRSFQGPSKRPSPTKGRTLASFWANSYCQIRHNQTYCKQFLMVHLVPYTDHVQ